MRMDRLQVVPELIARYLSLAEIAVASLRRAHPYQELLNAWRRQVIPMHGQTEDGWHYCFHGVGCRFEVDGRCIDVDFGPEGRCDGFDGWRLFICSENEAPGYQFSHQDLNQALQTLERAG